MFSKTFFVRAALLLAAVDASMEALAYKISSSVSRSRDSSSSVESESSSEAALEQNQHELLEGRAKGDAPGNPAEEEPPVETEEDVPAPVEQEELPVADQPAVWLLKFKSKEERPAWFIPALVGLGICGVATIVLGGVAACTHGMTHLGTTIAASPIILLLFVLGTQACLARTGIRNGSMTQTQIDEDDKLYKLSNVVLTGVGFMWTTTLCACANTGGTDIWQTFGALSGVFVAITVFYLMFVKFKANGNQFMKDANWSKYVFLGVSCSLFATTIGLTCHIGDIAGGCIFPLIFFMLTVTSVFVWWGVHAFKKCKK